MNILVAASQAFVGLFVDDRSLAIAILMIVLVSGIFSILMPDMPLVARDASNWMPYRAFRQCHESHTGMATSGVWKARCLFRVISRHHVRVMSVISLNADIRQRSLHVR